MVCQRTELCALKLVELRVCAQKSLHRLDILLVLEARKGIQIVDRFAQHPVRGKL